jgi:DNA-binding response OmpR family regulator
VNPVLVVIAEQVYREIVGQLLDACAFESVLCATWREAIARVAEPPSLIIADLDDVVRSARGLAVLRRAGWGETVPLIVLSYDKDVAPLAETVGAVAGFRKPISGGSLIATIERILTTKPRAAPDGVTRGSETIDNETEPLDRLSDGADGGVLTARYGPSKWLKDRHEHGAPTPE